ncbi:hypothetical protein MJ1HA_1406 [Metallosphaera sedula]|nr:hypothetical protein MJ1HA_1406 [Metallosphaera sedula]
MLNLRNITKINNILTLRRISSKIIVRNDYIMIHEREI